MRGNAPRVWEGVSGLCDPSSMSRSRRHPFSVQWCFAGVETSRMPHMRSCSQSR